VAVGSRVRVRPARWRGGWRERNASREQRIEACKTRQLVECEVLAAPEQISGTEASAVISRYYAGWYVQALDAYYAEDSIFAGPGYLDVSGAPPLVRSGDVAASAAVRVPGAPVEVPLVKLGHRVAFQDGRAVVGRVRCARCEVELVATTKEWRSRQIVRVRGSAPLRLERGGRRGAAVRVLLDGRLLESGIVSQPR
jgi:hypothetical protein